MSQKKSGPDIHPELIQPYLDQLEESVCLYNLDGRVEYCNPAHVEMFGYADDELIGLAHQDLPYLSPEFAKISVRLLDKIKSEGRLDAIETQVRRKDKTNIWIETKVTLLRKKDNKPFAIQTMTRDITERVEAEQDVLKGATIFKQLLEGLSDPLLIHEIPDKGPGIILDCNRSACNLSGYSMKELLGKDVADFHPPGETGPGVQQIEELMKGNSALFEQDLLCKNGSIKTVEVHNQIIDYRGNKAIMAIIRDISQRKAEQEELKMHLLFEQIVSKISSRFINMPDEQIDRGIEDTLQEVSEYIGAGRGAMYLISDKRKTLSISHEWCYDPAFSQMKIVQNLPIEMFSYSATRLQKMENVIINTPDDMPSGVSGEKEWFEAYGFHALFFVPIISEDSLVGTLGFSGKPLKNVKWPRQYGNMLRYIAIILYSAIKRKEIYQKLRRTQFTLDNYSDCVYWLAPDFQLIDVNPSASKMLGYSREELLSMHVYDFDPQFPLEKKEWFWNQLKKSSSFTMEALHTKKSGESIPVEISANHITFEGDEFIVVFARDITERKTAEQAILSSQEEYKKIFENVVDIFYEASLDGKLLNVTPSVERITKYKREDLIGQPMVIFYYDQDVREPLLKELSEKGYVRDFELDVRDRDGTRVPCSLTSRLISNENGRPERIVGSLTDLRHRKEAETRIRQLSSALEQSPVSVIITDTQARIIYVNNTFTMFSGLELDKVIGVTPFDITRGQIPEAKYEDLWESVRSGKIWRGELEYTMKDERIVWLSVTVSPIFDEKGQVSNFVGILEEITKRKIYEEDLKRAKEQAERSDRLKSAFLANMSHEIRTPMNAILGFSSLLKEEDIDLEQSNYYIDIINSKGKDLMRIISDIIDISRIEAGDLLIRMEPLEIFEFIRDIYEEYKEDTQLRTRANLQLRLHIPEPGQQAIVNTDPARLKQIFTNLIHNAIKFTPDGYIEIGFDLLPENNIRLFVRDTGIGIPHEKQKIIFERFRQIDESHTREFGGTGLGLAICKNLVEKMGSTLFVKSLEGQGSEFQFTLKSAPPEETTPDPVRENEESQRDAKMVNLDLKGKKILIVEDDGSSYLFLETLLRKHNPEIFWAKSGHRAIELLKKEDDIDLVLMDIRMPEMNGLDTTRKIREIYPDLPIIAQTAYAQISDMKMALDCGCNDYISKPIEALELNAKLLKYLN